MPLELRVPSPLLSVTVSRDLATGETSLHVGSAELGPIVELLIPRGLTIEVTDQEWKMLHLGSGLIDHTNPHGVTVGEED